MRSIERVLIVGAGWVGRQVAARLARYGVMVWLVDRHSQVVESALEWIKQQAVLEKSISTETPPPATQPNETACWTERVHVSTSLRAVRESVEIDLILESIPEQLSLKKRVLREVSALFPPPTLIVSNSSYFVPSLLCGFVSHPSRFAHWHFHVPVLRDSVVDIVGCSETDPAVLECLQKLTERIGQSPLRLRREHPGYIFNWLLQSVLRSALELAALDVADPSDIDKSWTAVTGMPLGPFAMMDRIGLDVIEQVLSNARWGEPPEVSVEQLLALLAQHTARGELGEKSGVGFYRYDEPQG
jgi:3-hydroxybutyryl-CoA dehydrogenase